MSTSSGIFNVVIGTAGHIDHGKSSLVERLTGVHPDRLPEERNRGLTIDLGFAPWTLANGLRVGIIDVPGHERLIKNMVAGATGIDLVLLIVAADDSVMPQTREHLTIMQILGLKHGVIAITKIDAVERDLVELVGEEIRETVAGTFLADAPIVEVSSITGEGFDELTRVLNEAVGRVEPRTDTGVFRMPIQRVFSRKGLGTVVTGVPISGTAEIGDTLEIVPLDRKGRVRGIQAYKSAATAARAGHSSALNLSDVDFHDVHRGMVAATPGYFSGATMLEATLRYLPDSRRPLLHQSDVRVHVGTTEALGKIFLLDRKRVEPGEEALVQIRLAEPVVAAPGDRYVLRLHSPMVTLGGGEILDRSKWRLKTGKQYVLDLLATKREAVGDQKRTLLAAFEREGYTSLSTKDLSVAISLPVEDTQALVDEQVASGELRPTARAGLYVSVAVLGKACDRARQIAAEHYERNPRRLLMERSVLRDRLSGNDPFLDEVLQALTASGEITLRARGAMTWREFGPRLSESDEKVRVAILSALESGGFQPPSPTEIAAANRWNESTTASLFGLLEETEEIVRLADGVWFHRSHLEQARDRIRAFLATSPQMTAGEAKDLLGSTRKYMIPLLEHFDREGLTVRKGDHRELRPS